MSETEKNITGKPDPDSAKKPLEEKAEAALAEFIKDEQQKKEASRPSVLTRFGLGIWQETRNFFVRFFEIGDSPGLGGRLFMGIFCVGLVFAAWFLATRPWWGPNGNERSLDPYTLGSPEEVFGSFKTLWFDRALTRNLIISLWRIQQGFGLAVLVGVPIGILCGAFRRIDAFFAPISLFGRNVPVVALAPLVMCFVGLGEPLKVTFLFIACVAFVMFDSSRAIAEVREEYLDTAYTLGASRFQTLTKVMIPLALPSIFNSIRLLFGLAFGYLMVVEMLDMDAGAGFLILTSQKRGPREHIVLLLLCITGLAYLLDRILFLMQKTLFPYRYGRD